MALFVKKMKTGQLSFTVNGKRRVVKSGELVECEIEDFGKHASDFDIISPEPPTKKGSKPISVMEREIARYQEEYRLKSWILNKDFTPGFGQLVYKPNDLIGLKAVLYDKEQEEAEARYRYSEALRAWRYQVNRDPYKIKQLSRPSGQYIESIAVTTAKLNHVLAEKKEVIKRIKAIDDQGLDDLILYQKKMAYKGSTRKNREGMIISVDGHPVEYRGEKIKKPYIPSMDMWLKAYMDECKARKILKSQEKSARSQAARSEFLEARKEKKIRATQEKGVKL